MATNEIEPPRTGKQQSQWGVTVALVVLVVMVFGITFATQYLGDTRDQPQLPGTQYTARELTFKTKQMPPKDEPPVEQEMGTDGYQDFWFVNEEEGPVDVWLNTTSCKCSHVVVYLAPRGLVELLQRRAGLSASQVAASTQDPWSWLGKALATNMDKEIAQLRDQAEGTTLDPKEKNASARVPAGAIGWVRLAWKGERQGANLTVLKADLWMDQKNTGPVVQLVAGVRFVPPLRILNSELTRKLGEINPADLPRNESIVCWSSTRDELKLKAHMLSLRNQPDKDPFVVEEIQPLSKEECASLQAKVASPPEQVQVRCAYRVRVKIRDREKDGKTLLDIGPFRRQVEIKMEDSGYAYAVTMSGVIRSDLVVGGAGEEGQIRFGTFRSNVGAEQRVPAWTDNSAIESLELDRDRTAKFLEVTIPKPQQGAGNRRTWALEVKIPPGAIEGKFPREDVPELRDCAVYLKAGGPTGRTIRIPVDGLSNPR